VTATSPVFGSIALMGALGVLLGVAVPLMFGLSKALLLLMVAGACAVTFAILSGLGTRVFVVLLAFLLPMNFDVHFLDQNLRVSVSSLLALLLWTVWLLERTSGPAQRFRFCPSISAPALAFLCATGLSLVANGGGPYVMARIFEPMCDFLLYLYLANALRTEGAVREVVWALLLGALVQCGAALTELGLGTELTLQFSQPTADIWQQQVGQVRYARVSGLTEHANVLAIYLSAMSVLAVSLVFSERRRSLRVACWVGISLAGLVIVNTFSRSAWAVFALFVPGVFLLNLWKLRTLQRAVLPIAIAVSIAGVGVMSPWVSSRVAERLDVDLSMWSRVYMIEIGLNMVEDNPVFGVGMKNYRHRMFEYDDTDIGMTTIFPGTLHNVYVLIASEQGLLGLAAFVWLNLAIFWKGWRFLAGEASFLSGVGLSCWCWIWMLLLFGMANPFPRFSYLYLPLGILAAISHLTIEPRAAQKSSARGGA
jgi:O-antigen ligase